MGPFSKLVKYIFLFTYFYVFERQREEKGEGKAVGERERERDKRRSDLPFTDSLPTMITITRMWLCQHRSLQLHLGLPRGGQGPKLLSHHLLPPFTALSESWIAGGHGTPSQASRVTA